MLIGLLTPAGGGGLRPRPSQPDLFLLLPSSSSRASPVTFLKDPRLILRKLLRLVLRAAVEAEFGFSF
jgi:hypothetical protein